MIGGHSVHPFIFFCVVFLKLSFVLLLCHYVTFAFGIVSRFQQLSSILEPGRTPTTDKAIILSDAIRMVNHLRNEAKNLKESHDVLQDKINDLKVCLFPICFAFSPGTKFHSLVELNWMTMIQK